MGLIVNGVSGHIGSIGYTAYTARAHVAVGASATDNPLICNSSRRGDAAQRIRVMKKALITTFTGNGRGFMNTNWGSLLTTSH